MPEPDWEDPTIQAAWFADQRALAERYLRAAAFAERWRVVAGDLSQGKEHPTIHVGAPQDRLGLAPMLRRRADILHEWAAKDDVW